MDDSDLVQRYKEKAKEWIFQSSNLKYTIEDDEILDLNSLSFDSDEDTWLYSSNENPRSDVKFTPDDRDFGSVPSMSSNFNENLMNSSISPLSPLIDLSNISLTDSLIHLPDVSQGAVDRFLTRTPVEDRKSKTLIKTVLSNQFHAYHIANEKDGVGTPSKTELNAFQKSDNTFKLPSSATVLISRKNRSNNEPADKSYVLHSVENKLFTITDADTNDSFSKISQNRDSRNQKVSEEDSIVNALIDSSKSNQPSAKVTDFSNAKEYEKKLCFKSARTTPENDENDHRSTGKKSAPICQSTPMLLGRFLKYNKTIDDSKNFSTWRTSAEFLKDDDNDDEDGVTNDGKHQMNISYIKDTSPVTECSPNEKDSSFSKLENYLNSTYSVQEDDQASSTSESSVSSFGNKPTYSIRDVQKNAELQERNLKQQLFQSNYGPGSSKSSEISSSNESISAFSPISSSNEGFIDSKINVSCRTVPKLSYPSRRPHTADNHSSNSRGNPSSVQKRKLFIDEKSRDCSLKSAGSGNSKDSLFRSKLAPVSGGVSPRNYQKIKHEQNTKNVSTSGTITVLETPSQLSNLTRGRNSMDCSPNVQNATFVSKLSVVKAARSDSPSKERKSSDDLTVPEFRRSVSPGPVSHIPRPSSRIPKLRSSSSCTRYSSYSSLKK